LSWERPPGDTPLVAIVVVCGLLAAAGLFAIIRWGGVTIVPPDGDRTSGRPSAGEVTSRYLWWLTVATVAGLGAGLYAGVGGRLVMRLLAETSPAAQGRITEADEVVGVISLDGTLALIVFAGIQFGVLSVIVYLLIRRWLPAGPLGGSTFGVGLLVVVSTFAEPLRPDNVDFGIVGPGWLSLLTFGLLVVTFGMLVAALAGGFSSSLRPLAVPLRSNSRGVIAGYWPLLLLVVIFPLGVLALAVGLSSCSARDCCTTRNSGAHHGWCLWAGCCWPPQSWPACPAS